MSDHQCSDNPPKLDPNSGSGHVEKLAGLDTYVSGSVHSNLAVLLVSHVFGELFHSLTLDFICDKTMIVMFVS